MKIKFLPALHKKLKIKLKIKIKNKNKIVTCAYPMNTTSIFTVTPFSNSP